jgi:hypothetical protein
VCAHVHFTSLVKKWMDSIESKVHELGPQLIYIV